MQCIWLYYYNINNLSCPANANKTLQNSNTCDGCLSKDMHYSIALTSDCYSYSWRCSWIIRDINRHLNHRCGGFGH